jgi:hypothetical protein
MFALRAVCHIKRATQTRHFGDKDRYILDNTWAPLRADRRVAVRRPSDTGPLLVQRALIDAQMAAQIRRPLG